jgi:membrane-associated phospholipid phosphatase
MHTMASFAGALPWLLVNPWIGALAILLACFVGFSRMVVMAHWLRDVLMSIVLSSLYFGLIYFWI